MIQVMARNQHHDELRSEMLEIIENTKDEAKLGRFLNLRGLFFLRQWLSDRSTGLKEQVFRILDMLPINTLNVLESAQMMPVVKEYQDNTEEDRELQASAAKLLKKWSDLKQVYVIPKVKDEEQEITEEVHIPRNRLNEFQPSMLKALGLECSARASFSRKNSLADTRALKITGLKDCVANMALKINEILSQEPPETPTRAASSSDDSNRRSSWRSSSNSPSSSSKRKRQLEEEDDGMGRLDEEQELLPGWKAAHDQDGGVYYWNEQTRESTWEKPVQVMTEILVEYFGVSCHRVHAFVHTNSATARNMVHSEVVYPLETSPF